METDKNKETNKYRQIETVWESKREIRGDSRRQIKIDRDSNKEVETVRGKETVRQK